MDANALGEGGTWLAEAFVSALVQSLEAMTTERPIVEWAAVEAGRISNAAEGWLWREQPVTASSSTVVWLGTVQESALEIGKYALAAGGIDDGTPEDFEGTWSEIISQALSATASSLG